MEMSGHLADGLNALVTIQNSWQQPVFQWAHNQPQAAQPIIFNPDKTQFTLEGITLPVLRLEKMAAMTEKIKQRIESAIQNQFKSSELRE